jgi:hypothetical protein
MNTIRITLLCAVATLLLMACQPIPKARGLKSPPYSVAMIKAPPTIEQSQTGGSALK